MELCHDTLHLNEDDILKIERNIKSGLSFMGSVKKEVGKDFKRIRYVQFYLGSVHKRQKAV